MSLSKASHNYADVLLDMLRVTGYLTEKTCAAVRIGAWTACGLDRIFTAAAVESAQVCHNVHLQTDLCRAVERPAAINTVYSERAGLDSFHVSARTLNNITEKKKKAFAARNRFFAPENRINIYAGGYAWPVFERASCPHPEDAGIVCIRKKIKK